MGKTVFSLQVMLPSLLALTCAYRQRVVFHDAQFDEVQENSIEFQTHVPDNTFARSGKAVRLCVWGSWDFFLSTDYESWAIDLYSDNGLCYNLDFLNNFKSFRYNGAWETSVDALSLYSELSLQGKEFFIDNVAYGGITVSTKSMALSGTAHWMIYEGVNFNGSSACTESTGVPYVGIVIWMSLASELGLRSIGSVLQHCRTRTEDELEDIREQWRFNLKEFF